MKGAWTIAWKDFKSLVTSPMFSLIACLCACIWSFTFMRLLFQFTQQSQMSAMMGQGEGLNLHFSVFATHISYINIIFIFAIPALTMRLLAEEKKMRTYDLLLTSPVTAFSIAFGKFLAGFMTAAVLVGIGFLYIFGSRFLAEFNMAPVWSSFLGLLLLTGVYVAVGLFASSLTQSIMLSVVIAVIFNLFIWFLGQGADMSDDPTFQAVMNHISIGQQLYTYLKGTLAISSTVFFASAIALFVFLTERVVESSRWR
jgi:ABC-2 type transport system permease protein